MKRGLLMSFALISVLASILFLAGELREISYEVSGQTNTAPDHSLFMKTVITGHRLWVAEMQERVQVGSSSVSSCGTQDGDPILYSSDLCSLQQTPVTIDLVKPVMSMCEGAFVTEHQEDALGGLWSVKEPANCPSVTVKMDEGLSGNIKYSLGSSNTVTIPYSFQIEDFNLEKLNSDLRRGHSLCEEVFSYYECMGEYVQMCGYDTDTLCLLLGNMEVNFHVSESNLPTSILLDTHKIQVRNPSETFSIVQFDSAIMVSPSQVEVSDTYKSKIIFSALYEIKDLTCETSITYCNNVLTIPKTEDHVYVQFNEDKYYTFKQ